MNIPSVPNAPMVDKNGNISDNWRIFMEQMIGQLQVNVSDDGYITPFRDENDIAQLNKQASEGGLLYSTDAKSVKANVIVPRGTTPNFEDTYEYSPMSTYHELTNDQMNAIPSGQRNGKVVKNTTDTKTYLGTGDAFIQIS